MAGRKRRASTSSVETVDENQIRWLQESSVLRTPSSSTSVDNLPVFELRDAVVLNKDGETLENALHVVDKGPYIIRGHLIIEEPAQRSHLIMRVRSSVPIEVRKSVGYSIGEAEDGRPLIWVQGKSAWYEIEPSTAYRPIYNKMCEATTLYYHVMDIYKVGGLKKPKKSKGAGYKEELSDIFLQYAIRVGDGSTFDEVVARCGEHAFFFFWQCTQDNPDDFDWKSTGFYKWLTSQHPDLFKKAQKLAESPPKLREDSPRRGTVRTSTPRSLTPSSAVSRNHTRRSVSANMTPELEPESTAQKPQVQQLPTQRLLTRRGPRIQHATNLPVEQPPPTTPLGTNANTPIVLDESPTEAEVPSGDGTTAITDAEHGDSAFDSVLAALNWVYDELSSNKKGVATITALNKVYFAYKFPEYRDGNKGCYRKPVEEVFHYNAQALLDSVDKGKFEGHEFYNWLQEMAATPFAPKALGPQTLPFQLIPRGNRPQPLAGRSTTGKPGASSDSTDLDVHSSNSIQTPRSGKRIPGQRSGKKSILRLTASQKRSHSVLESDSDEENTKGPKRSHYFPDEDDEMEDVTNASSEPDTSSEEEAEDEAEPIKLYIQAERVPSTKPLGPDGTWTCEEDECGYVVRGGDVKECQTRIQEHFNKHERVARLNLAVAESRGHLPINHLLDKIKNIGERLGESRQSPASGITLPQHIKRKLPI